MKYKFEQALIARGYFKIAPRMGGDLWVKGKAIVSLGDSEWEADYSDEITDSCGGYSENGLSQFEATLKEFDNVAT